MKRVLLSRGSSEQCDGRTKICPAVRIPGFLLVWAVILFTLAATAHGIAGNGKLLAQDMLRCAPPEISGLPATEYEGVGQMTAGYLTDQETEFQYIFSDETGGIRFCFQPHEAEHMSDCRNLIRLAKILALAFGAAALILAGTGAVLRKYRKMFAAGMMQGLAAAGIVFGLMAVWSLLDFDGFFILFHRIAFTNDGWLLDSRTDLLIRLMPTAFFIVLGLRVLIWVTAAAFVMLIVAIMIRKDRKQQSGTNDEL